MHKQPQPHAIPVPRGGSPRGTGGSPVLPVCFDGVECDVCSFCTETRTAGLRGGPLLVDRRPQGARTSRDEAGCWAIRSFWRRNPMFLPPRSSSIRCGTLPPAHCATPPVSIPTSRMAWPFGRAQPAERTRLYSAGQEGIVRVNLRSRLLTNASRRARI